MEIATFLAEKFGVVAFIGLAVLFDFKFHGLALKRMSELEAKQDSNENQITTVRIENEKFYTSVKGMQSALESQKDSIDKIFETVTKIKVQIAGGD